MASEILRCGFRFTSWEHLVMSDMTQVPLKFLKYNKCFGTWLHAQCCHFFFLV